VGRITTEGVITEFPITVERAAGTWVGTPWDITTGPDGNLWFTDMEFNQIGRITPSGAIQTFAVPGAMLSLEGITAGPDGNVWFTDGLSRAIPPVGGNRIGRITPDGVVTMFPVPTANSLPGTITTGPDGNLWFVEQFAGQVGRITPAGVVTEFALPPPPRKSNPSRTPLGITAGVDGKMWFSTVGSLATVGHFQP
jgi:virginiamycin B lyase